MDNLAGALDGIYISSVCLSFFDLHLNGVREKTVEMIAGARYWLTG
jgi:hypothetical protein